MYSRKYVSSFLLKGFAVCLEVIMFVTCDVLARSDDDYLAPGSPQVGCSGNRADVVFVLDSSNSIWVRDFRKQLKFVKDVIKLFPIDSGHIQVGLVTYADIPRLHFHLGQYGRKSDVQRAVGRILHTGGFGTHTAEALHFLREVGFRFPVSQHRFNVTRIGIVVTDGRSDDPEFTRMEAELTKEQGIHLFAVGVGANPHLRELDAIASDPKQDYTIVADDYRGLDHLRKLLAIDACAVNNPTAVTTRTIRTTPTTTTNARGAAYSTNPEDQRDTVSPIVRSVYVTPNSMTTADSFAVNNETTLSTSIIPTTTFVTAHSSPTEDQRNTVSPIAKNVDITTNSKTTIDFAVNNPATPTTSIASTTTNFSAAEDQRNTVSTLARSAFETTNSTTTIDFAVNNPASLSTPIMPTRTYATTNSSTTEDPRNTVPTIAGPAFETTNSTTTINFAVNNPATLSTPIMPTRTYATTNSSTTEDPRNTVPTIAGPAFETTNSTKTIDFAVNNRTNPITSITSTTTNSPTTEDQRNSEPSITSSAFETTDSMTMASSVDVNYPITSTTPTTSTNASRTVHSTSTQSQGNSEPPITSSAFVTPNSMTMTSNNIAVDNPTTPTTLISTHATGTTHSTRTEGPNTTVPHILRSDYITSTVRTMEPLINGPSLTLPSSTSQAWLNPTSPGFNSDIGKGDASITTVRGRVTRKRRFTRPIVQYVTSRSSQDPGDISGPVSTLYEQRVVTDTLTTTNPGKDGSQTDEGQSEDKNGSGKNPRDKESGINDDGRSSDVWGVGTTEGMKQDSGGWSRNSSNIDTSGRDGAPEYTNSNTGTSGRDGDPEYTNSNTGTSGRDGDAEYTNSNTGTSGRDGDSEDTKSNTGTSGRDGDAEEEERFRNDLEKSNAFPNRAMLLKIDLNGKWTQISKKDFKLDDEMVIPHVANGSKITVEGNILWSKDLEGKRSPVGVVVNGSMFIGRWVDLDRRIWLGYAVVDTVGKAKDGVIGSPGPGDSSQGRDKGTNIDPGSGGSRQGRDIVPGSGDGRHGRDNGNVLVTRSGDSRQGRDKGNNIVPGSEDSRRGRNKGNNLVPGSEDSRWGRDKGNDLVPGSEDSRRGRDKGNDLVPGSEDSRRGRDKGNDLVPGSEDSRRGRDKGNNFVPGSGDGRQGRDKGTNIVPGSDGSRQGRDKGNDLVPGSGDSRRGRDKGNNFVSGSGDSSPGRDKGNNFVPGSRDSRHERDKGNDLVPGSGDSRRGRDKGNNFVPGSGDSRQERDKGNDLVPGPGDSRRGRDRGNNSVPGSGGRDQGRDKSTSKPRHSLDVVLGSEGSRQGRDKDGSVPRDPLDFLLQSGDNRHGGDTGANTPQNPFDVVPGSGDSRQGRDKGIAHPDWVVNLGEDGSDGFWVINEAGLPTWYHYARPGLYESTKEFEVPPKKAPTSSGDIENENGADASNSPTNRDVKRVNKEKKGLTGCRSLRGIDIAFVLDHKSKHTEFVQDFWVLSRAIISELGGGNETDVTFEFVHKCRGSECSVQDRHSSRADALRAVDETLLATRSTSSKLIDKMTNSLKAYEPGSRHKVGVYMTDSSSGNLRDTLDASNRAKNGNNVEMFAVGFGGDVNPTELQAVASCPVDKHFFRMDKPLTEKSAKALARKISKSICPSLNKTRLL